MPGGDRTGPQGGGPMTGKGMGNCVGRVSGGGGRMMGRGMGRGGRFGGSMGFGAGFGGGRYGYGAGRFAPVEARPLTQQEEKEILKSEERMLNDSLQGIKDRLSRLEDKE